MVVEVGARLDPTVAAHGMSYGTIIVYSGEATGEEDGFGDEAELRTGLATNANSAIV